MINSHPYINLKAFIRMKIITKDYKNLMKQVGICLPSYNESENIVQLINKILETGNNIIICVVDDNSPDNTCDLINQKFSNNENIKIIKRV